MSDPRATCGRTFSTPGDFRYHCKVHPIETGIVKVFFPAD
ncbi:plastocyanin [Streptomyces eurocidicus]|uniref:Plastocyanin n=1 Tax=Streptomyces eurocidicus TaxID=66423 RepID=A0A7W8F4E8_STREU|nr:plastocyanin [Streptomyces eurocidicus]